MASTSSELDLKVLWPRNDLFLCLGKQHMRPVTTKWETSHKISFPSYNQIHIIQTLSFKMIYYMSGLLTIWGPKTHYFLKSSFVFFWFLNCSMSHISLSSLATCRSFCENRSHILWNCTGDVWSNPIIFYPDQTGRNQSNLSYQN